MTACISLVIDEDTGVREVARDDGRSLAALMRAAGCGLRRVEIDRLEALAAALQREIARRRGAAGPQGDAPLPTLSRLERQHVLRALELARGNKKAAAEMLGVSRRAFYRRLERLSLGDTIARRPAAEPRRASAPSLAEVAHA